MDKHRKTLNAQAKSVPTNIFISYCLKDIWINDSTPKHFQPTGMTAHPASLAFTHDALDIGFRRGLGKRKVGGTKPHLQPLLEKGLQKVSIGNVTDFSSKVVAG